jgi:hypothetical protein
MEDEWARVGEYLDRLAFENDRLEAELKVKKERRLAQGGAPVPETAPAPVTLPRFDEARETVRYETQTATETTQGMHLSYDALKRDLSGLMSDLDDFKHTRAGLESRLQP